MFDDTVLAYDKLESNCSATFTSNLVGNKIRIEWYDATGGSNPLNRGDGVLLTLFFDVIGEESETTVLDFTDQSTIADETGEPIGDVVFIDGSLFIVHVTGIKEDPGIPQAFRLHNCYPNPFNPTTRIDFDIPYSEESGMQTTLRIYNVFGQLIRTLIDDCYAPGTYSVVWDGRNDAGTRIASGVYFYRLEVGPFAETKKMVLLR